MAYYVDTSIWRDYFESRSDGLRPLGDFAFEFFRVVGSQILISDLVVRELKNRYDISTIDEILSIAKPVKVKVTNKHVKHASILSHRTGVPVADCIHAVIAKENDAIVVTRDRHFIELSDYVRIMKPEDLL